jgi:UDP-2,3-diacylglucosamine pyrophosphatase LpxH
MSIPVLGWIKIHPRPDSYPFLAGFFRDFLTDNAIIKSRKIYIVGHFFTIPPGLDFHPVRIFIRRGSDDHVQVEI